MNFENIKDMKEFCKYNKIDVANLLWDTCEKSQEKIEALKAENERLKNQLENSVQLYYKPHDKMYFIALLGACEDMPKSTAIEKITNNVNKVVERTVMRVILYSDVIVYVDEYVVHREFALNADYKKLYFYKTKQEAEARLKELEENDEQL